MNKLCVILLFTVASHCCLSVSAKDTSATFKKSKLIVEELKEDAPELRHEPNAKAKEIFLKEGSSDMASKANDLLRKAKSGTKI